MDLQIASSHRPLDDVGLAAKYILIQRAEMDGLMAGHLYVQQGLRLLPEDDCTGRLTRVELCENRTEIALGTNESGQFHNSGLLRVKELTADYQGMPTAVFHLSAFCIKM